MATPSTLPPAAPSQSAAWFGLPLLLTLLLFAGACFDASFISDDWPLLLNHQNKGDVLGEWVRSTHLHATGTAGGYLWRPLTASLHQVVGEALGRSPVVFRLLNLGIHLLVLLLAWSCLRVQGASARGAGLLLTAWAVHPLLPDAVCWMSDTYDLLAAALLLGAARVALATRPGPWLRAGLAGLLFLLALLSKESSLPWVVTLPAALALLRGWREALRVGVVGALVAALHSNWHRHIVGSFEGTAIGLADAPDLLGVWTQFAGWPLTMPVRNGFTHLVRPGEEPIGWPGLLMLPAVALAAWWLERRGARGGRGLLAALGSWVALLSPVALASVVFGQQPSRYLYLPLVLSLIWLGGVRLPLRPQLAGGLALAWVLAWLPATWGRVADWASEDALYESELRMEPDNAVALSNVARLRIRRGELDLGLEAWERALAQPPPSAFVMDVQQERLDFAQTALRAGQAAAARGQLDAFLAEERRVGAPVDPSILDLSARIDAAVTPR